MNKALGILLLNKLKIVLILSVLVLASNCGSKPMYVGSKKSDKYHLPDCKWAKKIKPGHLIEFHSRTDALKTGYYPCRTCNP